MLKCKFRESHCSFHTMKQLDRSGWPYEGTRQLLALLGKDWSGTSKQTPLKMLVVDLSPIPKAWAYYMHHTLDTNLSGFDLIAERALTLYYFLKNKPVNIGRIIVGDICKIA